MKTISILHAGARVDDKAAVDRLLASIPSANEIRRELGRRFSGPYYDEDSQNLFIIASDGAMLACITVNGCTIDDASKVVAAFEKTDNSKNFAERVKMAVENALHSVTHAVH